MSGTDASISMTTAGRRFSRTVSAVDSMRSSSSTTRRSSGQAGRCSRGVCGRGSRGGCSCDSRGACSCAIPRACEGIGVGTDPPPSAARRACPPAAPHRRLAHRRLEPPAMVRGIGARARRHPNGELRPERVAARRVAATASRGRASGRPRRLRRPRPLACCGRGRGRAPDPLSSSGPPPFVRTPLARGVRTKYEVSGRSTGCPDDGRDVRTSTPGARTDTRVLRSLSSAEEFRRGRHRSWRLRPGRRPLTRRCESPRQAPCRSRRSRRRRARRPTRARRARRRAASAR